MGRKGRVGGAEMIAAFRLMCNGRKPSVFPVRGGEDRLGLNSSKEC